MKFAPRIAYRVRAEIERLADCPFTPAEITRIVGVTAEELGYRRPSYEQVRAIVRRHRRQPRETSTAAFLVDVLYRPGLYQHHVPPAKLRIRRK